MNLRPSGYEPDELPGCSTPRHRLAGSPPSPASRAPPQGGGSPGRATSGCLCRLCAAGTWAVGQGARRARRGPYSSFGRVVNPLAPRIRDGTAASARVAFSGSLRGSDRSAPSHWPVRISPGFREKPDYGDAGWSSPVARQAHNLKVASSNLAPATKSRLSAVCRRTRLRKFKAPGHLS